MAARFLFWIGAQLTRRILFWQVYSSLGQQDMFWIQRSVLWHPKGSILFPFSPWFPLEVIGPVNPTFCSFNLEFSLVVFFSFLFVQWPIIYDFSVCWECVGNGEEQVYELKSVTFEKIFHWGHLKLCLLKLFCFVSEKWILHKITVFEH